MKKNLQESFIRAPAAKVNKVIFTQNFTLLTFLFSLCTVILQSKLKKQKSHHLHSGSFTEKKREKKNKQPALTQKQDG